MPRQVQIYMPSADGWKDARDRLESYFKTNPNIFGLGRFVGDPDTLYIFRTNDKRVAGILEDLAVMGVGNQFGTIDIVQLQGTTPAIVSSGNRRKYRVNDRAAVEEINSIVDNSLHLTFDYIAYTVTASIISAVGLATNSAVTVVAAMILDPFMGPILGMTFGTAVRNWAMVFKSLRNEMFGVLLAFFVGCLSGIPLALVEWGEEHLVGGVWWGNPEQMSRGTIVSLASGAAIAIPCGAGAALSVVQGASMALVGVAVSAALLPPVVNAGMNVAYGVMGILFPWTPAGSSSSTKWLSVAMFSFILFLINLVLIYVTALVFFKIKRIGPPRSAAKPISQFAPARRDESTSILDDDVSSKGESFRMESPADPLIPLQRSSDEALI
eukprot:TRINITY_DN327_c0_g1_i1.p1 TRINITY_DN327_c0_g1~~TRINITY_DN327_c0_g1_i1.p1  ORF type:complete len:383 (-),score=53.01 TRINITY_DN327_c0_g1_i1:264-1412(-)